MSVKLLPVIAIGNLVLAVLYLPLVLILTVIWSWPASLFALVWILFVIASV